MKHLYRLSWLYHAPIWSLCLIVLHLPLSVEAKSLETREFHTHLEVPLVEIQNLFPMAYQSLIQVPNPTREMEAAHKNYLTAKQRLANLILEQTQAAIRAEEERKQLDRLYQDDMETLSIEANYLGLPFSDLVLEVSMIPSGKDFTQYNNNSTLENNPKYAHLKTKIEDLKLSVYMKNLFYSIANNSIRQNTERLEREIFILQKQTIRNEHQALPILITHKLNPKTLLSFLNNKNYGLCRITQKNYDLEFQVIEAQDKADLVKSYLNANADGQFPYQIKQPPFISWFAKSLHPKFGLTGTYSTATTYLYDINKNLIGANIDVMVQGRFNFGDDLEKVWPNTDYAFKVLTIELNAESISILKQKNIQNSQSLKAKISLPLFTSSNLDTENLCLDY